MATALLLIFLKKFLPCRLCTLNLWKFNGNFLWLFIFLNIFCYWNNEIIFQFFYYDIANILQILLIFFWHSISQYTLLRLQDHKNQIFKNDEKLLLGVAITSLTIYFLGSLELILLLIHLFYFWKEKNCKNSWANAKFSKYTSISKSWDAATCNLSPNLRPLWHIFFLLKKWIFIVNPQCFLSFHHFAVLVSYLSVKIN